MHTYISVSNATYYLVPLLYHYMFRPCMAIIMHTFTLPKLFHSKLKFHIARERRVHCWFKCKIGIKIKFKNKIELLKCYSSSYLPVTHKNIFIWEYICCGCTLLHCNPSSRRDKYTLNFVKVVMYLMTALYGRNM